MRRQMLMTCVDGMRATCLLWAEAAEPQLVRSEVRRWQERMRGEQENLRAALRWAVDRGEAEMGLRTAGALWRFWHYWAQLREARRWLESLLALPSAARHDAARAKGLNGLAVLYWQGDADRAAALYEQALNIHRQMGNEQQIAETLHASSLTAVARNEPAAAKALAEEALDHYGRAGDPVGAAVVTSFLQGADYFFGNGGSLADALAAAREAIEISRDHGRMYEEIDGHGSLAQLYQTAGDYPRAILAFHDTLRAWSKVRNVGMLPWLKMLAALELAQGRPERAVRLAAIAARAVEELGGELPEALTGVGNPLEEARALLDEDAYARAVQEGLAMTVDQAVAYALEDGQLG
jgi:tetratricopeptide (TPR) repeat protein